MIKIIVLLLSLFVAGMGLLSIFAPRRANHIARMFSGRSGLYVATAIRLVLGAALLFLANTSRAPIALRILGVIILIVGIVVLLLGLERHRRLIDWWLSMGTGIQRAWGVVALALGVFLIYAIA